MSIGKVQDGVDDVGGQAEPGRIGTQPWVERAEGDGEEDVGPPPVPEQGWEALRDVELWRWAWRRAEDVGEDFGQILGGFRR